MDRRSFLVHLAGTPLIFGLQDLFAQDAAKAPEWYGAALKRMKETGRCGIALLAPRDSRQQAKMGKDLMALIEGKNPAVVELLCEAVFMTVSPEAALKCPGLADEKHTVVVLGPEGKPVASDAVPLEAFADPEKFAASLRPLLHGKNNERLQKQAEAIGKSLTDPEKQALAKLDAEELAERSDATETLAHGAERLVPFLVYSRLKAPAGERRGRFEMIVLKRFEQSVPESFGPQLPYGAQSCREEACPWCGQASVSENGRKLLRFLSQ